MVGGGGRGYEPALCAIYLKMADASKTVTHVRQASAHLHTHGHTRCHTHTQKHITLNIYHTQMYTCSTRVRANWQADRSQQTQMCRFSLFSLCFCCSPSARPPREGDKDFVMKLLVNLAAPVLSSPRHKAQNAAPAPPIPSPQLLYILIKAVWER